MILGQTTKLKDEFRCLSPDYSGALCVSVSLWFLTYVASAYALKALAQFFEDRLDA